MEYAVAWAVDNLSNLEGDGPFCRIYPWARQLASFLCSVLFHLNETFPDHHTRRCLCLFIGDLDSVFRGLFFPVRKWRSRRQAVVSLGRVQRGYSARAPAAVLSGLPCAFGNPPRRRRPEKQEPWTSKAEVPAIVPC